MNSVVLVSGCPGSGKTTLSRALAEAQPTGLHLVSDQFYDFIPHRVDPTTRQSDAQNRTIMRAVAAASAQFAKGGYAVYLDGVIGPWFLPEFRPHLESTTTHYVVLRVLDSQALHRVRERQGEGLSPIVRQMHRQFAELGSFERHAIDTTKSSPSEIVDHVSQLLRAGRLELDWSEVAT